MPGRTGGEGRRGENGRGENPWRERERERDEEMVMG
jgi:hypothetical protein